MRAVFVDEVVDIPVPQPADGEVLIEVAAAGVNRADLLQRAGHYPPPPGITDVLGLECSGTIAALGSGVEGWAVGDQVCALLAGGGYAEYVAVPAGQVARVPDGMTLVEAAGVMETFATVWSNVFMLAGLKPGQTLLVHGGSSGIGTTAIQLATALGAQVAVTVGSAAKAAYCRDLGATWAINYKEDDFVDALRSEGVRPDVILDIIGAKYLAQNVKALARDGRIVTIGLQGGVKAELNLGALLAKNGTITATSLRMRPLAEKTSIVNQLVAQVWPLCADKQVWPRIHACFPLERMDDAHRVLQESQHTGKVILNIANPAH